MALAAGEAAEYALQGDSGAHWPGSLSLVTGRTGSVDETVSRERERL